MNGGRRSRRNRRTPPRTRTLRLRRRCNLVLLAFFFQAEDGIRGLTVTGVQTCGLPIVGNWDEIIGTGGWDTGARPPMALGVEAAGLVAAIGDGVQGLRPGDAVTTHSLPAGSWAEQFIAAADHVAPLPAGVPMAVAAALPVPALTADHALDAVAGQ